VRRTWNSQASSGHLAHGLLLSSGVMSAGHPSQVMVRTTQLRRGSVPVATATRHRGMVYLVFASFWILFAGLASTPSVQAFLRMIFAAR
jgi:hypothetical protein